MTLPFVGDYSVEMRTYDLFGHRSHFRIDDLVEIRLKDLELYGIYKWKEETNWNSKKLDWSKSGWLLGFSTRQYHNNRRGHSYTLFNIR